MENKPLPPQPQDKELDLVDLIKIIWKAFVSYIWSPLVFLIRFAFKKWYYLLAAFVVGIGLSFLLSAVMPEKYPVAMEIRNNIATPSYFTNRLELLQARGPIALQQALGLDEETMKTIKDINTYDAYSSDSLSITYMVDYKDELSNKNLYRNKQVFAIEFEVTDTTSCELLQSAILNFFTQDPYIISNNHSRLRNLNFEVTLLKKEVSLLDSLRNYEYFQKPQLQSALQTKYKDGMLIREESTHLFHQDIIALTSQYRSYLEELQLHSTPIEVLTPMHVRTVNMFDWTQTLIRCVVGMVAFVYLLLLLIHFWPNILAFAKKK